MSFLLRILCAAPVLLPGQALSSQSDVLPTVDVVSSRLPQVDRVPVSVERRLERDDIERRVPLDTAELLQSLPSIDVSRAGGEGGLSFVSIRGGDPNFTLVTLDGIKLNDPTNSRGGGLDLYMIPPQLIDAIEVVPRPASAVQGSDGLSGIVSISTRPLFGTHLRGSVGNHSSTSYAVSQGGDLTDGFLGSVTFGHDDKTTGVEGDKLRQSYFLGRGDVQAGDGLSLDLVSFAVDGESSGFPEDSGGDRLAVIRVPETRDYRREVYGANAMWELQEYLTLKGSGSYTYHREETDNPGIAPGVLAGVPAVSGKRTYTHIDSQLYLVAQPSDLLTFTAGFAYDREEGSTDDIIDFGGFTMPADFDLERSSWSAFTEFSYRLSPRVLIQSGIRHDMPDSAPDETSVNLGISYQVPDRHTSFSATYGEGYKLPSMFALGHSLVGNPDLSPEYSKAVDLGVRKRWPERGLEIGVSLFWNEYRDLIDFDPLLFTNVNRGRVDVDGFDVQLDWQIEPDLAVGLHLTYSDAEIANSDDKLRRRPEWKGGADLRWTPEERLDLVTTLEYTGEYHDSSIPTGMITMPSFWRVNVALNWQYTDAVQLSLGVKNLLDDDFEESVGFSNGGIRALLGLNIAI